MRSLVKRIQENIFRYELFRRGARIIIGVSGGLDSICLLDILYKLKGKYDLELIIAHVNYGLRGKDSERDEKLVRDLAKKCDLPFEIVRSKRYKMSDVGLEEKLRKFRYDFFEKIRQKYKASSIAVGHNLNDQAETVALRILRGTGLRGLGAIKFRNNQVIRPLLNIHREEILGYLRKNNLPFRIDKSNLGSDFTRNKIRNKLLPCIAKSFNPRIEEVLYKLSQSVADDYDFIRTFAAEWFRMNESLPVSKIAGLHPALQREVLRLALEKYKPDLREIEAGHVEEILKIVKSGKNKKQKTSFKGLRIERKGDKLVIGK